MRDIGTTAIVAALLFSPALLRAQEDQPAQQRFSIRKADEKLVNGLEDFERYRDKQAWEKAFAAIEVAAGAGDATASAMVTRKDGPTGSGSGFMFPAQRRVQELLCSLPPEGRDAYRLFNDAKAKQLYDQASSAGGADELTALRKIVDQYFITSIGDQAADRLADALFEAGDFGGAETLWSAILTRYPDSELPAARLQIKRGVAMARSGRWNDLASLISQLRNTSGATATVSIGGRDVTAVEFLQSLVSAAPTSGPTSAPSIHDETAAALPSSDTPAWQCVFLDDDMLDRLSRAIGGMGWNGLMAGPITGAVPPAACDGRRVYANWLGIGFAVDLRTGKLLWRTDKFTDMGEKANMLVESMIDVNRYATVVISNDLVAFVRAPLKNLNYLAPLRLSVHESATGKQKWSSESGALSGYTFSGTPAVVDGLLFAVAMKVGGADAQLLAIHPEDGKLEYTILLGQAATTANWRGGTNVPSIQIIAHAGMLYVVTNNGAILAVSAAAKRVEWAFTCEGPAMMGQPRFFSSDMIVPTAPPAGRVVIRDGMMYVKESGADAVYAIDLSGPAAPRLKWRRPLDRSETIAGVGDGVMVTIGGQDVCGIELEHQRMLWSARLPAGSTLAPSPALGGNSIFAFSSRGVYQIDLAGGAARAMFRGYDHESQGGSLQTCGGKWITVSNRAITAYPIGDGSPAAH